MGTRWSSARCCAGFQRAKVSRQDVEAGGPRLSQIESGKLILGVEIVGNKKISQHKILSHMQTRPDRMYDPRQLEADVRELYRTELFARV